jgi:hypothetical protein
MSLIALIVLGFSAARLGSLLAREHGPYDVLDKIRYILGVRYDELNKPFGTNMPSTMILCVYCNTVWIGIVFTVLFAILGDLFLWLCLPLAISAGALVVDKYT